MSIRILLVDDNRDILSNVRDYLSLKDWIVETETTGPGALERTERDAFDLVILDVGLPGLDGMSVCRMMRSRGLRMPILMLTARDSIDDRVEGLSNGADDYIVKPFSLRELAARVEAHLRRAFGESSESLRVESLVMNLRTLQVARGGKDIRLNPTCMKLLKELMLRSPGIVSRERLEQVLWGGEAPESDSLRSNLYLLRQAVDKPFDRPLIHTYPGLGWAILETGKKG